MDGLGKQPVDVVRGTLALSLRDLSIGTPETVIEGQFWDFRGRSSYDVAPDGRIVIIRSGGEDSDAAPPQIHVVLNWFTELQARVPTGR